MIKISKTIQINGKAPFAYNWISSDGCATFSTPVGTTNANTLTTTIEFTDSACINTTSISVRVSDANGCTVLEELDITDPCSDFEIFSPQLESEVNANGEQILTFLANVAGGTPGYKYDWVFDESVLTPDSSSDPNNGALVLKVKSNPPFNSTTTVHLIVTDSKGCQKEVSRSYTFCTPIAQSYSYQACKGELVTILFGRKISVLSCNNSIADWSTISFNCPNGVQALVGTSNGNTAFVNISLNTATISGLSQDITWTVKSNGVVSTTGVIHIQLVECVNTNLPVQSFNYTFPCSPTLPSTIKVDLDNPDFPYVSSPCDIDWNTFTFVAQAGQTLTNATHLETSAAHVSLNLNHEIVYTYYDSDTGTDTIAWKVCDKCGICSNTAYFFFVLDCITAPVTVDKTACVSCGESVLIDVLAGITTSVNPNTLTVVSTPLHGTATVVNGKILYTANSNYNGTDEFDYQVSGFDINTESNVSTVTVTIICAGESQTITTCN